MVTVVRIFQRLFKGSGSGDSVEFRGRNMELLPE